MSVPVAYATILLVWSTTPLGITWSNEAFSPFASITMRMTSAAVLGWCVLKYFRIELAWNKAAVKAYSCSLLGIYGAMLCTYVAAQAIPSGLISVIFALSPVLSGILAWIVLREGDFTRVKVFAYVVSFIGLVVVCWGTISVDDGASWGIALMLIAAALYSLSGVLVQRTQYKGHPLSLSVGTLILSTPLFMGSWWVMDGQLPSFDWSGRSLWAIVYLAIFGSLIGFMAYFHVLQSIGATAVATVTLITPVMALALGMFLNDEELSLTMVFGTGGILFGLALYFQGDEWLERLTA